MPAMLTGFALAFARAVGEYGSVIFIAGNLPNVSEIAPLLIVIRLSEFRYADATAIAVVMLVASFLIIFAVNRLQRWAQTRTRRIEATDVDGNESGHPPRPIAGDAATADLTVSPPTSRWRARAPADRLARG